MYYTSFETRKSKLGKLLWLQLFMYAAKLSTLHIIWFENPVAREGISGSMRRHDRAHSVALVNRQISSMTT